MWGVAMGMLDDRVVIVTGGGGGLGRQHCLDLACHGATVIVDDLGGGLDGEASAETPADEVMADIEAGAGTASADATLVSYFEEVAGLVARTVGPPGGRVNPTGLDHGLRVALGTFPSGLTSGGVSA